VFREPSSAIRDSWLTTITGPLPRFFVSVDSMRLTIFVSCLESTLVGDFISVDSKGDGNSERTPDREATEEEKTGLSLSPVP